MRFIHSLLVFAVLIVFVACSTKGNHHEYLNGIDSLIQKGEADSALVQLSFLEVEDLSDEDFAFYNLLRTQALVMVDIPVSDTLINKSISFYELSSDKEKLVRSYCVKSSILFGTDKSVEGMKYLKKSEKIATQLKNSRLLMFIYEAISVYNLYSNNKQLALLYGRKFLDCAQKKKDDQRIGLAYQNMHAIFHEMQMPDSAKYYIEKTIPYITYQLKSQQPYIYNNVAVSYLSQNDWERAKYYLKQSLKIKPAPHTYALMAEVYSSEGNNEKAEQLWKEALMEGETRTYRDILKGYAGWLKKQGRYEEATVVIEKYNIVADSLEKLCDTENLYLTQTEFEKEQSEKRLWKLILFVAFGAFLLAMTLICLWYYHKRKMNDSITQIQKYVDLYENQLMELEKSGKKNKKEIAKLNRKLKDLQGRQTTLLAKGKILYVNVMSGDNMQKWNKEDMSAFVDYYCSEHHDFQRELERLGSRTTYSERVYLTLLDMGFDAKQVKQIMVLSDGALRTMLYRLRRKRGDE